MIRVGNLNYFVIIFTELSPRHALSTNCTPQNVQDVIPSINGTRQYMQDLNHSINGVVQNVPDVYPAFYG